ncbi:MAG: hypothetical protein J6589_10115 [Snodgrassella sp.]|uniref:hypothetical protein n=1 Tax=Snodgrassella sp. TaxID=2815304 RepID=UPI002587E529|nr:hypothetical protein [Snodgrassella sp.]MCO6514802.1 hypothetical protein [Snodgrassella sp.]MCO6520881.1 hypothetical protein [Snodgrassella sp.]
MMNNQTVTDIDHNIGKAKELLRFESIPSIYDIAQRLVTAKKMVDAFSKKCGKAGYADEVIPNSRDLRIDYRIGLICNFTVGSLLLRDRDDPYADDELHLVGDSYRVKLGQIAYRSVHHSMNTAYHKYIIFIKSSLHPKTTFVANFAYSFCNLYINFLYCMVTKIADSTVETRINHCINYNDVTVDDDIIKNIIDEFIAIKAIKKHADKCKQSKRMVKSRGLERYEMSIYATCAWLYHCKDKNDEYNEFSPLYFQGIKLNVDAAFSTYHLLHSYIGKKCQKYKQRIQKVIPAESLHRMEMDFCEHFGFIIAAHIDSALCYRGIQP